MKIHNILFLSSKRKEGRHQGASERDVQTVRLLAGQDDVRTSGYIHIHDDLMDDCLFHGWASFGLENLSDNFSYYNALGLFSGGLYCDLSFKI